MPRFTAICAGLCVSLAALSACTSTPAGMGGGSVVAARPSGVEGSWQDATGGVSTFSGGSFQTVASDTGEKLSEGRYVMNGQDSVSISGTSLARQRRNLPAELAFNCLLATLSQLNCTSASGQQFILTRRASV